MASCARTLTQAASQQLENTSYILAALTAGGGLMGYIKGRSVPSLVAGGAVGILYGLGAYRQQNRQPYGIELSLLASIILGSASIPRAIRLRKPVPISQILLLLLDPLPSLAGGGSVFGLGLGAFRPETLVHLLFGVVAASRGFVKEAFGMAFFESRDYFLACLDTGLNMASQAQVPAKKQQDLQVTYSNYKNTLQQIAQKIGDIEQEAEEHKLVLETLEPLSGDRKCFRLINGVLVERTVEEVVPALKTNQDGLKKVLDDLVKQYKSKQDDLDKWKKKNNVQVVQQ
ncbi:putative prefoldin subunit 2 [Paramyrothecium foliicola]|nr:putative prefoldin subunit 2 [Paramyrothecium foliicola]